MISSHPSCEKYEWYDGNWNSFTLTKDFLTGMVGNHYAGGWIRLSTKDIASGATDSDLRNHVSYWYEDKITKEELFEEIKQTAIKLINR